MYATAHFGHDLDPESFVKDNLRSTDALITSFAEHRQILLRHTGELLCGEGSVVRQPASEREAKLSAILVSSLEELKVAEEELVERTAALADLRGELDQRVRGAYQLFDLAPACLLVTDIYGTILDVNHASQQLLKRNRDALERQPMSRFIATDGRRNFRDELGRVVTADGVNDWRLLLLRPTAGALTVSATIRVVKSLTADGPRRLFWSVRSLEPAATALDA